MKIIIKNTKLVFSSLSHGWLDVDLTVINDGWNDDGQHYSCLISKPQRASKLIVNANNSQNAVYAFMKSNSTRGAADYCDGTSRVTVSKGTSTGEIDIPIDCNYIYIYLGASTEELNTPSNVSMYL